MPKARDIMLAVDDNATSSQGRQLAALDHKLHKSGTFCLGNKLAPLVMLLGCQRCGTGSLYEDIMQHVKGARRAHSLHGEADFYAREQHFFATDSWSLGVKHYLDHFPPCPKGHGAEHELSFTMDATPAYLRKPIVVSRLQEVYPNVAIPALRFVIILRDPVDRLHAYWDSFVQAGAGVNDFAKWVDLTMGKVQQCQRSHGPELWPPPDTGKCDPDVLEGVAAGLYVYQLQYWFKKVRRARKERERRAREREPVANAPPAFPSPLLRLNPTLPCAVAAPCGSSHPTSSCSPPSTRTSARRARCSATSRALSGSRRHSSARRATSARPRAPTASTCTAPSTTPPSTPSAPSTTRTTTTCTSSSRASRTRITRPRCRS